MARRNEQLQIRVTAAEKRRLRELARRAGLDVSAYVLSQVLRAPEDRFHHAVAALRDADNRRFALAELSDALTGLVPAELERAVARADVEPLDDFTRNYVAATVEYLCAQRGIPAPAWTRVLAPLDVPWFATSMAGLRLHLLRTSPLVFKRRNLFVDAGPDARV